MKKVNFRKIVTENKTLILAGKDAESNEKLVRQANKNEWIFHTEKPGSPFMNIKGKAKRGDIKFAAIFCAKYSKDWKKNKKDVEVHQFKKENVFKDKNMKTGTFGVKKFKKIKVKKKDIINFKKKK